MFALGLVTCLVWDTHLTWWAFIIALLISLFFYLPIGIIQATTNVQIGLNVITEFIIGYMQPGRPLAMMMFKMYGYIKQRQLPRCKHNAITTIEVRKPMQTVGT